MLSNKLELESKISRRNLFRAMRTEYIREYIQEAYKFYKNLHIEEDTIYNAINILSRFLYAIHPEWPSEKYGFYSAALYIAIHFPHNNNTNHFKSKKDFIRLFNGISLISLDWYISRIESVLNLYRLHDDKRRTYWLDEQALEGILINKLIKEIYNQYEGYPIEIIVDEIIQIILNKLKIIPKKFRRDIWNYIFKKLKSNYNFL